MPEGGIHWRIDGDRLLVRCEGEYPSEALVDAWVAALEDPRGPAVCTLLVDVRRSAALIRRPIGELRRVAGYFAFELARRDVTCALLVEGAVRYGLMRMVASWIPGGVRVRVFRDEGQALGWLSTTKRDGGAD